ncbi:cell division protein ZapE [Pantoea sp. SoEX]|uniref:cell division protein ZapE n=1 Tax=Pantoea sp. SoEX TaxID=2576763 RepID=UPI00135BC4AF|nr:cell division protein ZapE [Pantoea sp. SoEX]MXP51081.1 cell division protein ZapE [Pantoea sp. SoEX]
MQNFPLGLIYKKSILINQFVFNEVQYKTISLLNELYNNSFNNHQFKYYNLKKWLRLIIKYIKKNKIEITTKGAYLWGNPGCGKTWIINLFFQSISSKRKMYFHFYSFILFIRQKLKILQGHSNPLLMICNQLKKETDILFIDEFYISDANDSILIGTIINELLKSKVILILTSNIHPEGLNHKYSENNSLLLIIKNIKKYFKIINMNCGIDYRNRYLKSICLWKFPLNSDAYDYMEKMFYYLSGNKLKTSILNINYRDIIVLGNSNNVLSVDFNVICGEGRNQHDYVRLCSIFHSILVHNIPIMMYNHENEAKRFLLLVDELYANNIRLIISAETDRFNIYQGKKLKFEYKRCVSRLEEMQSDNYFKSQHQYFATYKK